jgi:transposase-like protein
MSEVWAARISDYRASGERVAAWCERNQGTSHQLYYWMRKLREAERQVSSARGRIEMGRPFP